MAGAEVELNFARWQAVRHVSRHRRAATAEELDAASAVADRMICANHRGDIGTMAESVGRWAEGDLESASPTARVNANGPRYQSGGPFVSDS